MAAAPQPAVPWRVVANALHEREVIDHRTRDALQAAKAPVHPSARALFRQCVALRFQE